MKIGITYEMMKSFVFDVDGSKTSVEELLEILKEELDERYCSDICELTSYLSQYVTVKNVLEDEDNITDIDIDYDKDELNNLLSDDEFELKKANEPMQGQISLFE